jgi:peptide/nickel transport system permease protein
MWRYIVRRVLSGLVMLFAATLMTFAVFRLIPFTPACIIVPCGPGSHTTDAQIRAAEHKLGTDRPVPVQYAKFVWGVFRHGTFGRSWKTGGSVDQSVRASLPQTISLLLGGIVVLLLLAIPLAALSALRAQTAVDRAILLFAILGIALHPLLLGVGLTNFFSEYLHILPLGSYCHFLPVKAHPPPSGPTTFIGPPTGSTPVFGTECGGPLVWARHMVLPWLTFSLFFLPLYTRMIRARFIETMDAQYVVAARGRGVPELRLIRSHALRPALLPLVTMVGLDLGGALMAVIYIDSIYGLGAIGTVLRNGIADPVTGTYDLPLIAAVFFIVAAFTIFVMFVVDILYAWLDPRVRTA